MKLKNCPFCGGKAKTFYHKTRPELYGKEYHGVTCMICGAEIFGYPLREQAVERWNRRVDDEDS